MRAVLQFSVPLLLLLVVGSAVVGFITCALPGKMVHFDTPSCSSLSSCVKAASFDPRISSYSWQVGRAWYNLSLFRNDLALISKACGENAEANGFAFIALNGKYMWNAASHMRAALLAADASVTYVRDGLSSIHHSLQLGGIDYARGTPFDAVDSQVSLVLYDLDHNVGNRPLSAAIRKYLAARSSILSKISTYAPDLARIANASNLQMRGLVYVVSTVAMATTGYFGPNPAVFDDSVGIHDSVFTAYRSLMESYFSALDDADKRANGFLDDAKDLRNDVFALSSKLGRSAYSVLDAKYLSLIAPSTVKYRAVVVATADSASVRAKADSLYWSTYNAVSHYRSRDSNYIAWWSRARASRDALSDLYNSLSDDYAALDGLADSCQRFLSKYSPRSDYARIRIPAIVSAIKSDNNIALRLLYCKDGLDIYFLDRNYAATEAMLKACERSVSCWDDYSCYSGDAAQRLDCCLAFRERKENELRSSSLYASYSKMRNQLAHVAAFCNIADLEARLSSLPANFSCEDNLRDAVTDLLSLRQKYGRTSDCAPLRFEYDGFFDSKEISTVRVIVHFGIPGVSSRRSVPLPVRVVGYRTLDSNGLQVSIDGNVAVLSGSGSATLEIIAYPVPLISKHLGDSLGYARIRLTNGSGVPVRYRLSGRVVSTDGMSYVSGQFLYFPPNSSAVVEVPVLSWEQSADGSVTLRNDSGYKYHGLVVFPFAASNPPAFCISEGNTTACNISLDPYSSRLLKLGAVTSYAPPELENISSDESNFVAPTVSHGAEVTSFDPVPASYNSRAADDLRHKLLQLVSELNAYYRRALELNVTYLLPFSAQTLRSAEDLIGSGDPESLHVLYNVLQDERDSLRAKAGYSVAALSRLPEHARDYSVAKSAFERGDYVLALAVAEPFLHGSSQGEESLLPSLLGVLSLILLFAYVARTYKPKKKRRIPKI